AGTGYIGELGYYQPDREWKTVATSAPTTTPPDAPSQEKDVIFSTPQSRRTTQPAALHQGQSPIIPVAAPRWPFEPDAELEGEQLHAIAARGQESLPQDAPPFVRRSPRQEWTSVQEQILAEMIRVSFERREWISSGEIVRLVQRELEFPEMAWSAFP